MYQKTTCGIQNPSVKDLGGTRKTKNLVERRPKNTRLVVIFYLFGGLKSE